MCIRQQQLRDVIVEREKPGHEASLARRRLDIQTSALLLQAANSFKGWLRQCIDDAIPRGTVPDIGVRLRVVNSVGKTAFYQLSGR
jgi:hypothetical protein